MDMSFDIDGIDGLDRMLAEIGAGAIQAAARSLYESAEAVMTRSKEVYVPVDTGALRSSGNVQYEIEGDTVTVVLGYGGPAAGYAVAVHEINKNYRNGKVWKYLEVPLKEAIPEIETKLSFDLQEAMEKNATA